LGRLLCWVPIHRRWPAWNPAPPAPAGTCHKGPALVQARVAESNPWKGALERDPWKIRPRICPRSGEGQIGFVVDEQVTPLVPPALLERVAANLRSLGADSELPYQHADLGELQRVALAAAGERVADQLDRRGQAQHWAPLDAPQIALWGNLVRRVEAIGAAAAQASDHAVLHPCLSVCLSSGHMGQ
jgi:hypothetical protein